MAIQQREEKAEKGYDEVWKEVEFKDGDLSSEERGGDEEDPREKWGEARGTGYVQALSGDSPGGH